MWFPFIVTQFSIFLRFKESRIVIESNRDREIVIDSLYLRR